MGLVDGAFKAWPGRRKNQTYERYSYAPLRAEQIRLLYLLPGTDDDSIRCSLVVHSLLDAAPDYEALSYTWGDPANRSGVVCDGKGLSGPKNLGIALGHLRHPTQTRVLWADALCINQADVAERESQVLLMGAIYKAARSVVVWLGSSNLDSAAAFRVLRQIHDVAVAIDAAASPRDATNADSADRLLTAAELAQRGLPAHTGPEWRAVGALFWRPWFTRVWIVQEVALAQSAVVYCGVDSMSWSGLVTAAGFIRRQYQATWVDLDLTPAVKIQQAADRVRANEPRDLAWLLSSFRHAFASDPADKVYGLLGLADADHGIVVNYSAPIQKTYGAVARRLLIGSPPSSSSLDVLSLVGDSFWRRTHDLPSWVPDWATPLRMDPYLFGSIAHVFHACGATTPVARVAPDGHTLSVRGIAWDRVSAVGDRHLMALRVSFGQFGEATLTQQLYSNEMSKQFHGWEEMVLGLQTYPTGEDIRRVLQHTLLAGADAAAEQPPPGGQLAELYSTFREHHLSFLGAPDSSKTGRYTKGNSAELARRYNLGIRPAANGRRLFVTKGGYVGLGPMSAKPADHVVLFCGGRTAYVLRERRKGKHAPTTYTFVGEAYVHGMMNGEGFAREHSLQDFDIV